MSTIVVGFDPGLAALGFGVVALEAGQVTHVAHGALRTSRRRGLSVGRDLTLRVDELARGVAALLDRHRPEAGAIEEFRFYGKGVSSSLQLANGVGMLRESLRARGIASAEYSAQAIKRAVVGNGNADKGAVQRVVQLRLALGKPPRPVHAADALAAAITHASQLRLSLLRGGRP